MAMAILGQTAETHKTVTLTSQLLSILSEGRVSSRHVFLMGWASELTVWVTVSEKSHGSPA